MSSWKDEFWKQLYESAHGKLDYSKVIEFKNSNIPCDLKLYRFRPIDSMDDLDYRNSEISGDIFFSSPDINDPYDSFVMLGLKNMCNTDGAAEIITKSINEHIRNCGYIACFNEIENELDSLPMWGHYASNRCGICLEYDVSKWSNIYINSLFPIQYVDALVDYVNEFKTKDPEDNAQASFRHDVEAFNALIMTKKLKSWSYESEWRLVIDKKTLCEFEKIKITPDHLNLEDKQIVLGNNSLSPRLQMLAKNFKSFLDTNGDCVNDSTLKFKGVTLPFIRPTRVILGEKIDSKYSEKIISNINCINMDNTQDKIIIAKMKCDYNGIKFDNIN